MSYNDYHCKPKLDKPDTGKGDWKRTVSKAYHENPIWDKIGPRARKKREQAEQNESTTETD